MVNRAERLTVKGKNLVGKGEGVLFCCNGNFDWKNGMFSAVI